MAGGVGGWSPGVNGLQRSRRAAESRQGQVRLCQKLSAGASAPALPCRAAAVGALEAERPRSAGGGQAPTRALASAPRNVASVVATFAKNVGDRSHETKLLASFATLIESDTSRNVSRTYAVTVGQRARSRSAGACKHAGLPSRCLF